MLWICFVALNYVTPFSQDYNILEFGCKPDGITLNTIHIQAAIDAAHEAGGGRVVIPSGTFLTGSIVLKTGVELHLTKNAVLLGSTDPAQYIKISRWKAVVLADHQSNIAITGAGRIDGQGRKLALHVDSLFHAGQMDSINYNFVNMRPKEPMRPQLVEMVHCTNIRITGVTLSNAACWVQTYDRCDGLIIDRIRVVSDAYWNNDGIDIENCRRVRITNCFVDTADDGICLKSFTASHFCDSIYIANCTVRSSASAIKFGTVSYGGFKNVIIEDIKVYDTYRSAIAIECVDGGFLENILVNNIKAVNTGNAIFIRLGKRNKARPAGTLKNVTLKNMKVSIAFERPDYRYDLRGPALPFFHNIFPSSITGIPGHRVDNVVLENIEITYPGRGNPGMANAPLSALDRIPEREGDYPEYSMFGELPAWGLYVRHVDGLQLHNIKLKIRKPDYRPAIVLDDARNASVTDLDIRGDSKSKHIILHKTENVRAGNAQAVLKM